MATGSGEKLLGRRAKVVISVPVATPGDFTGTTRDELEINASDDPNDPGLRIKFSITKTDEKDPNTSTITITNMSADHRHMCQSKGAKVSLEAGYVATGITRIFLGDIRTADPVREGSDWNTVLRLGDGERGLGNARLSESFAPGTGAGDVIKRLAQASGLLMGNVPDAVLNILQTYDHGYSVSGLVSKSLHKVLQGLGYTYSVQDGALQVLLPNSSIGAEIPLLSPDTGLLDSPEIGAPEKKGKPTLVKFRSLLIPVVPRGRVRLQSEGVNGIIRIKQAVLTGDTRGNEWFTEMQGVNEGG